METEIFQHYQILRRADGSFWELGRGAMAVTYKALDNNLRCPVALKVVSAVNLEDEHTRARFVREARAAAALRHRNIASVYHLGNDEQSYFYAMEFIDGETVEDRVIRRGPLPPAEALGIAAQVARALGAAARQGLVHRDIKPANVMVVREDDDESLIVKVIDFGLARRAVVTESSAQITVSGFVGTPQYASPEQIAERDLDTRSDIYSLGVTLWFMLTGEPTFSGPLVRISSRHLNDEPPWKNVAHLPAPVRALLARTLQKKPVDRPQSPSILRGEIEACLGELTAAPAGTTLAGSVPTEGSTTVSLPVAGVTLPVVPGENAGDATAAVQESDVVPQGPAPAAGQTLNKRFHLLEAVGEGNAGQVFRAADARHGDRPVAVKVIRPDLGLRGVDYHRLKGYLRRLRAAPHPCLIEVFVLDQSRGHRFVASEWINGFTLVDLLRRRGRLDLLEALRLLEGACDAAAHGSANGLHRLGLAAHQVLVHFPADFAGDRVRAMRAITDRPLAQWPEFELKLDAAAPAREMGRTPTWAGASTLVPASCPPRASDGNYFYALGALLYEMLNGTPPPNSPDASRETPPLPVLSEAANDTLQRALSANPGFHDEREFFDALLAASGLERDDLRSKPKSGAQARPAVPAVDSTVVPSSKPVMTTPATVSAQSPPATQRMAPTIRTKLLRPRGATPDPGTSPSTGKPPSRTGWWTVAAGAAGLAVVMAVGGYLLLPKHRAPAPTKSTPAASPAAPEEETAPPPDSSTPASADKSAPALP